MSEKRNQILIVVPTYNEKGNIETVYKKIFLATKTCDLLVVDDNSPDGTGQIADGIAKRDKRVFVLHRASKSGLGTAYVDGMKFALDRKYHKIIAMDADLSHDPINIPKMLELSRDHDLVIGSRYVQDGGMVNWGVGRFFISRLANTVTKFVLGLKPEDCSGGYKCYRAELLERIGMDKIFSPGYSFQVEILFRAVRLNARIVEFPIIFVNRHKGESKLSLKELRQFAGTVLRLRCLAWMGKI
jgi:dolichol-phosphate mannosyltransferase